MFVGVNSNKKSITLYTMIFLSLGTVVLVDQL